jgi:cytochrome P450
VADSKHSAEGDAAARALEDLVTELDACIAELQRARVRSETLLDKRRSGRPWREIVTDEARPLVVESISTVLGSLATAGHAWRREQASALQREQVSINRIAALFGVTRQRISALLRERDEQERAAGNDG